MTAAADTAADPSAAEDMTKVTLGWLGAATGFVLVFLAVPQVFGQFVCSSSSCRQDSSGNLLMAQGGTIIHNDLSHVALQPPEWEPWVDDPRSAGAFAVPGAMSDEEMKISPLEASACSGRTEPALMPLLVEAPLPDGYRPLDQVTDLHACVRVTGDGVAAARLIGSSGSGATDRAILRTIRSAWQFEGEVDRPQWVRVRLDAGPRRAPDPVERRYPVD